MLITTASLDTRWTIAVSDLATNWSDADGDAVLLAGIGISANGVTVTNSDGTLIYFDTNNVDDQFVCAISDGWGGTNFQTVYVDIVLTNTTPHIIGFGGWFQRRRDIEPCRSAWLHLRFGSDEQSSFAGRLAADFHESDWHKWHLVLHRLAGDEQSNPILPPDARAVNCLLTAASQLAAILSKFETQTADPERELSQPAAFSTNPTAAD